MKTATGTLAAYLATSPKGVLMADLFTITLVDGTTYRTTSAPITLVSDGLTYSGTSFKISGLKRKVDNQLTVDEQSITFSARDTDLIEGVGALTALATGVLNGAMLERRRAMFPAWTQPAYGSEIEFYGRVSTITDLGRTQATISVKAELVKANTDYPRNLYSPTCNWTLFDANCGANRAAFTVSATVATGSSSSVILLTGSGDGSPYAQGVLRVTSGLLTGQARTVRSGGATPLGVYLASPLVGVPAAGDTVSLTAGCDHTNGPRGCAYFGRQAFQRFFPNVPPPASGL